MKFKLTNETKVNRLGNTLFRIEATADIPSKNVKKGDKGGWLESETVNGDARIYGNAWVSGDAQLYGNAQVSGNAWVSGEARIDGNAWVHGSAQVFGNAWVSGDAQVSGNAWVHGNAQVFGYALLSAKNAFTKGWFIGGDDSGKIADIAEKTGSAYWDNQYVLGDYEINEIESPKPKKETINVGGKEYEVTDELREALAKLKEAR